MSIASVYNKPNRMEPDVTGALVRHTAQRLALVIGAMEGQMPALLSGHRVRIVDGNHLAATERRLKVLRGSIAGPLPGHALVVLDPSLMLATHIIPCEDGHAQERSLSAKLIELVDANDVWIADRNFCTSTLLSGVAARDAFYVIRHHASMRLVSAGTLKEIGRTDTGTVYEQRVTSMDPGRKPMEMRRVVIRLDKPTRDDDTEMAILTNLPTSAADALVVANLYRKRWTLETMFQSLTLMLEGEISALGYPRAALFGFGIALAASPVDCRKSFDGLSSMVESTFGVDPLSGHMFVFLNRRGDQVRMLFFDRTGYCIVSKRLERGTFRLVREAKDGSQHVEVDSGELGLMLEGIELQGAKRRVRWRPPASADVAA